MPAQLGVDTDLSIANGGLANKSQFFGDAAAEIISAISTTGCGAWDGGASLSAYPADPWFALGLQAGHGCAGVFSTHRWSGGITGSIYDDTLGHRTILSGY
jgi:hypothetical protein